MLINFISVSLDLIAELVEDEAKTAPYEGEETQSILDYKDLIVHYVRYSNVRVALLLLLIFHLIFFYVL